MVISHAGDGWEFGLDRYGINTVLLDQRVRGPLITSLKRNAKWTLQYEDNIASIFVRKQPIGQRDAQKQEATEGTDKAANDAAH